MAVVKLYTHCNNSGLNLPSGVREEAAELVDALADTVGPVDSGGADPTAGPEVLLAFASAKTHLQGLKKPSVNASYDDSLDQLFPRGLG